MMLFWSHLDQPAFSSFSLEFQFLGYSTSLPFLYKLKENPGSKPTNSSEKCVSLFPLNGENS
jgi:hypothetical protein